MASRNQPTYDFITGGDAPTPPRARAKKHEELRQNQPLPHHLPVEELHARIRTLEYELATLKQEKEVSQLQHDQDIRELQNKAEEDYRRSQKYESSSHTTQKKYDALLRETQDAQAGVINEKLELERRLRTATGQKAALEEERDEAVEQLASFERENGRHKVELEARYSALQKSFDLLRTDFDAQLATTQTAQQKLAEREAQVGQLDAEVASLKASGGTGESEVIKRQLSEQVTQINRLEKASRTQLAELTEFRRVHKSVEVVEEEKRGLEARLKMMETLRGELAQAQLRTQVLEEEKNSWASYLESQSSDEQFDSPEAMARAFMQQRIENASLADQLGAIQPELTSKDAALRESEEERSKLENEIRTLKQAPASVPGNVDAKAKVRLERQKTLATKEIEYLRAQLKAMDDEEQEFHPERHSEEVSKKIKELQDLVDSHRHEVEKLHGEMSIMEKGVAPTTASSPVNPKKRGLDEAGDERMGEVLRKNRKLQDELSKYKTKMEVLQSEAKAQNKQLEGLRSDTSSRHRILELRNNPTLQVHAIKQSTLDALRAENETLRAQIEERLPITASTRSGSAKNVQLVPQASLTTLQLTLDEKDALLASKDKSQKRLRDIFAAKAHEFRDAVFSLMGWKLEFQPNGRVKATSMFYPSGSKSRKKRGETTEDEDGGVEEDEEEEGEQEEEEGNFIVFDGENATMKVSGGVKSEFAKEIRGLVDFWVEGRGQVPCLLAAMTLEFFDRYHDGKGK